MKRLRMILPLSEVTAPISSLSLIGREGPLEIEIGVGKARFTRDYALANPEICLLGIEKSLKWLKHGEIRLEKAGVKNVRLVAEYAEPFLEHFIAPASVRAFHIYFPDPWPKRRQHRRRLFQPELLARLFQCVTPSGAIHIATDHEEYFKVIQETFYEAPKDYFHFEETARGPFQTNFQTKYEAEGRPIWFARAIKNRPNLPQEWSDLLAPKAPDPRRLGLAFFPRS